MTNQKSPEEFVITPGGPRPARQVHEVHSGEAVARKPDKFRRNSALLWLASPRSYEDSPVWGRQLLLNELKKRPPCGSLVFL
jgi:hypothetical protein